MAVLVGYLNKKLNIYVIFGLFIKPMRIFWETYLPYV